MVPAAIRGASARSLAFARPPAALVALFADDELAIAAPVLRIAQLSDDEWTHMLPMMSSANRSVLRHRRDLAAGVARALEAFGPVDFILPAGEIPPSSDAGLPAEVPPADSSAHEPIEPDGGAAFLLPPIEESLDSSVVEPVIVEPTPVDWTELLADPAKDFVTGPESAPVDRAAETMILPAIDWTEVVALRPPLDPPVAQKTTASALEAAPVAPSIQTPAIPSHPDTSFVSLASVALGLPVVLDAMRLHDDRTAETAPEEAAPDAIAAELAADASGPFQISDLVARIEAFQRRRDEDPAAPRPMAEHAEPLADAQPTSPATDFQFETDAHGVIRWVSGIPRSIVIGMTIAPLQARPGAQVDGGVAGAVRRRSPFSDGRLWIDGASTAAGAWQISGVPAFDPASGRFSGYRGWARRPRIYERAEPSPRGRTPATDSLRQLVHELRTPTTAIAGFAEMIEAELLGPVANVYRDYAGTIRQSAMALLGAIDDLDTAARIEAHALDLRPTQVALMPLLDRIAGDLAPLVTLRQAQLAIEAAHDVEVRGDDRAIDRLLARLLAALVSAAGTGEVVTVQVAAIDDIAVIDINRPRALAAYPGDALLAIDAESEAEQGAPLLGTGFALRLARNLASELGGSLTIGAEHLTLRLPAALSHEVGQVSTN